MRPGSRSVEIVVQQQYVLTSVTRVESGFRVVSGKTAQPRVTQEGGARINVKVHVAGYERIACRTAVSVESRLLCVTHGQFHSWSVQ